MFYEITMIGNIGNDATVRHANNGDIAISFNMAANGKWKDESGKIHERSYWAHCTYWVEVANIAQYLKQGKQVMVRGIPTASCYQDKNGNWKPSLDVRVTKIELLGGADKKNEPEPDDAPEEGLHVNEEDLEELPY